MKSAKVQSFQDPSSIAMSTERELKMSVVVPAFSDASVFQTMILVTWIMYYSGTNHFN